MAAPGALLEVPLAWGGVEAAASAPGSGKSFGPARTGLAVLAAGDSVALRDVGKGPSPPLWAGSLCVGTGYSVGWGGERREGAFRYVVSRGEISEVIIIQAH